MAKLLIIKNSDFSQVAIEKVTPEISVTIQAVSSPNNGGVVTGGGTYPEESTVSLSATPNDGYQFVQWSDGVATPNRTITVSSSTVIYTAEFEYTGEVHVDLSNPQEGKYYDENGALVSRSGFNAYQIDVSSYREKTITIYVVASSRIGMVAKSLFKLSDDSLQVLSVINADYKYYSKGEYKDYGTVLTTTIPSNANLLLFSIPATIQSPEGSPEWTGPEITIDLDS